MTEKVNQHRMPTSDQRSPGASQGNYCIFET
jgi:hypothetical protein